MKTVDLTPKKQNTEVSTRKIRCVSSPPPVNQRPEIALAFFGCCVAERSRV